MGMILAFLVCGNSAFAQEDTQERECDCEKGGLGLKLGKYDYGDCRLVWPYTEAE
jgi:hypothetical protein